MPRKRKRTKSLEVVNRDCAGIDIGKDTHHVRVDPERGADPVRSVYAFLGILRRWLQIPTYLQL